jgi:hypothetical protein
MNSSVDITTKPQERLAYLANVLMSQVLYVTRGSIGARTDST